MRIGATVGSRSYFWDGSRIVYLDADSVSTDAWQIVKRAWICPLQEKNSDAVLQEVWIDLLYPPGSNHDLTVTVAMDYNPANEIIGNWSPYELQELRWADRVTVALNLQATQCRSFSLTVECSKGPMRLLKATVIYRGFAGVQRRRLLEGAIK